MCTRSPHGHVASATNRGESQILRRSHDIARAQRTTLAYGPFFGAGKYFGGDLSSPMVEWLNKGLMTRGGWTLNYAGTLNLQAPRMPLYRCTQGLWGGAT
eukprot:2869449-Pyramimonas_sp.AAC.1